jgi:hypothetical protein
MAPGVLGHRIIPSAGAGGNENPSGAAEEIVRDILSSVPVTEAV